VLIIASGLIIMDAVFSLVLWVREALVLADAITGLERDHEGKVPAKAWAAMTAGVGKQGLTWSLHLGVGRSF